MGQERQLHFIVVVWGMKYCDTFLNVGLPTLLSPRNLAGLSRPEHALFRIFTSEHDVDRIKRSAACMALGRHVRVEIETFAQEVPDGVKKYRLMARIHMRALREAAESKAAVVFLAPDILAADGSMVALERLRDRPAVMVAAPRLKTTAVPEILSNRDTGASCAITVAPRDLVALAMKNLHPITESAFWGQPWLNAHPTMLYWRLGEQGMLARNFHLHPLLIDPAKLSEGFFERETRKKLSTIDDDVMLSMQASPDEFYIVTDSDELAMFEVSDGTINHGLVGRKERTTVDDLVTFAGRVANPLHQGFLRHRIWFHSCDRSQLEPFGDVVAASDALVGKLLHDLQSQPAAQPAKSRKRGSIRSALNAIERMIRGSVLRRSSHEANLQ
ncbi:MAG: hypothetical protein ACOY3L_06500 [Pseudomonadota bacterium]